MDSGILKIIAGLLPLVPTLRDEVAKRRGHLTKSDKSGLAKYVQRLNERRVFYFPYNCEVVESCLGSLRFVKDFTEETLAEIEHPPAKAALGVILDAIRKFLDKWSNFSSRHPWDDFDRFHPHRGHDPNDAQTFPHFFEDLGELRANVTLMISLLHDLDSKIEAPNLQPPPEDI
jgi:hypothetical protein